jgi:penicillin-binding protein 1C
VGVWAGNADNEPMYKISGIAGAAPIWHDFMEEALKGTPPHDFPRPDGIVDVEICETSGLLPTEYCPRRRTEVFIKGTEPTRYDDTYVPIAIDSATGLLWTDTVGTSTALSVNSVEACRGPRVERVYRLFPPDAADWARKQGIPEPPQEDCRLQMANAKWQMADGGLQVAKADSGKANAALIVTSPSPNSVFELSPQLPPDLQQIEVSARLGDLTPFSPSPSGRAPVPERSEGRGGGVRSVTLLVDGQSIATFTAAPYRALWRLAPGEHQVQAIGVNSDGQQVESETIRFEVTGGE